MSITDSQKKALIEKACRALVDKSLFDNFKTSLYSRDIIEQTLEDVWVFMKSRTLYIELKLKAGIKPLSPNEEF